MLTPAAHAGLCASLTRTMIVQEPGTHGQYIQGLGPALGNSANPISRIDLVYIVAFWRISGEVD